MINIESSKIKKIPNFIKSDLIDYYIMTRDDVETVVNLRNARHVRDNYIYQKPITISEHNEYYKTKIETGEIVQYIMKDQIKGEAVGCTFLKDIDFENGTAEFGVFIGDKNALGKGYGKDAVNQMKKLAFDIMELKKLVLRVLSNNDVACHTYIQAGFSETNRIFDESSQSGEKREIIIMEVTR